MKHEPDRCIAHGNIIAGPAYLIHDGWGSCGKCQLDRRMAHAADPIIVHSRKSQAGQHEREAFAMRLHRDLGATLVAHRTGMSTSDAMANWPLLASGLLARPERHSEFITWEGQP